ncbi:MAG: hypothetical protein ACE5F1_14405 [Planctomycetota bacterium]
MLRFPLAGMTLLALSATLPAQISATNQTVGWTRQINALLGEIHTQDVDNRCQAAKLRCPRTGTVSNSFLGGGTAYDARHQSVWISDGRTIEEIDLKTCRSLCKITTPIRTPGSVVSGLAISDRHRLLYQLETKPGSMGIILYDLKKCPPVPLRGGCSITFKDSRKTAGGLAYDEVGDLLLYTTSFPAFVGYISTLHVARPSSACQELCNVGIQSCFRANPRRDWNAVTGLAYDSCNKKVYATDGRTTVSGVLKFPAKCVVTWGACCDKGSAGDFMGLSIIPGWSQRPVGNSCLSKRCGSCSSMLNKTVGGDPALGNETFAFQLENGPVGNAGILFLGGGNCTTGLRVLCGSFYPALLPPPIIAPPVQIQGKAACLGTARMPVPVPVEAALCGVKFCAQWVTACPLAQGADFGLSPAIEFAVTGG